MTKGMLGVARGAWQGGCKLQWSVVLWSIEFDEMLGVIHRNSPSQDADRPTPPCPSRRPCATGPARARPADKDQCPHPQGEATAVSLNGFLDPPWPCHPCCARFGLCRCRFTRRVCSFGGLCGCAFVFHLFTSVAVLVFLGPAEGISSLSGSHLVQCSLQMVLLL